ncbi:MAG: hypothetical protein ISR65_13745 [Bacteriovoracaceae bacterium]|nr:hypothetical protein [Bacteriovoracaceae bacterium]
MQSSKNIDPMEESPRGGHKLKLKKLRSNIVQLTSFIAKKVESYSDLELNKEIDIWIKNKNQKLGHINPSMKTKVVGSIEELERNYYEAQSLGVSSVLEQIIKNLSQTEVGKQLVLAGVYDKDYSIAKTLYLFWQEDAYPLFLLKNFHSKISK